MKFKLLGLAAVVIAGVSMLSACNTVKGTADGAQQDIQAITNTGPASKPVHHHKAKKYKHKKVVKKKSVTPDATTESTTTTDTTTTPTSTDSTTTQSTSTETAQ